MNKSRYKGSLCSKLQRGGINGSLHLFEVFLTVIARVLDRRVLVLLVLGNEVVHIGLSLGKLHLIHSFSCVPVQECFAAEHDSELVTQALENVLDCSTVTDKSGRHREAFGRDVTDGRLDVVWDPFNEE